MPNIFLIYFPNCFIEIMTFVHMVQFLVYTTRLHPSVLAVLFEPHFGIPFHCRSWVCTDENQTSMSAFGTSRCLPPLILRDSATVICYLWWSVFWTPAVAIHTKWGPDPKNYYFVHILDMWAATLGEIVIQKYNTLPDLPFGLEHFWKACQGLEMGSRSNKLWTIHSAIHIFCSWKDG